VAQEPLAANGGSNPATLFEKVWNPHVVASLDDGPDVLAIDLQLIHEVTSLQAFEQLEARGLATRHPDRTLAMMDHVVPTRSGAGAWTPRAVQWAKTLVANCERHGIPCLPYGHQRQGIVHVVGPELGATLPGMTLVCGDSHTSTLGALGAIAFGIGTTQVAHVLATQSIVIDRPKTMEVRVDGELRAGVASKDIALALIGRYGNLAASGHCVEFRGTAVSALSLEARMTLCNMGIEFGARMAMIAPDERTVEYIRNALHPPAPDVWESAVASWAGLRTDDGARYDRQVTLDATAVRPYVTWGTTPAHAVPLDGTVPDPSLLSTPDAVESAERALKYMQLDAGTPIRDITIDAAFIGSCTNSRIEDLRAAADVLRGRRVARHVTAIVVPGSMTVKAQAEAEGLDVVFQDAGFRWGGSGCSLCIAANGDVVPAGARCASTTNRNFEGRQGTGARTHLMSPASVAASAVAGRLIDPAELS
jgi:3-isopropylmalate/(R)-2-methylmalate dehydratase large subunit